MIGRVFRVGAGGSNKPVRYVLISKRTGKILGAHKTLKAAKAQEIAIAIAKRRKGTR